MLLENKTVVITGCNRGIGKAILKTMTEQGADIFAVVRRRDQEFEEYCDKLAEKEHVNITRVYADFADEEQVKAAAKEILSYKKPINVLVNNVGVFPKRGMLMMTKMEKVKEFFQINFFSALTLTQMLGKNMIRNKAGSVIFVSSSAAFDGGANVEYSASKSAMIGAVRRLAVELGEFNIRVNAVAPGITETDLGDAIDERDQAITLSHMVMGRKGKPEEIADVILFLASEMSRFMTGQILRVDGGLY